MLQETEVAITTVHSPDGDPTPSNIASEGEGITRTGGRSCSELASNIIWREMSMETFTSSLGTQGYDDLTYYNLAQV